MKKLMFGAAALAACASFGVESVNTVGYNTQDVEADTYYMMAVQFQNVGSVTAVNALNDLVSLSGVEAVPYKQRRTSAAQIQVMNGSSYDFYYYLSDALLDEDSDDTTEGWADSDGVLAGSDISLGSGFWFKAPVVSDSVTTASVTLNGEVIPDETTTVSFLSDTYTIIANPYPADVAIKDIKSSGITAVPYKQRRTSAAQIQVRNGSSYDFYYYLSDALLDEDSDDTTEGWADSDGVLATATISAGKSFWIKAPNAGELEFDRP